MGNRAGEGGRLVEVGTLTHGSLSHLVLLSSLSYITLPSFCSLSLISSLTLLIKRRRHILTSPLPPCLQEEKREEKTSMP